MRHPRIQLRRPPRPEFSASVSKVLNDLIDLAPDAIRDRRAIEAVAAPADVNRALTSLIELRRLFGGSRCK